jgi:hypothetical protein
MIQAASAIQCAAFTGLQRKLHADVHQLVRRVVEQERRVPA